jgi:hypothetical protein
MTQSRSTKREQSGPGSGQTLRPRAGFGSLGTGSLLVLVCVVFVAALMMVVSLAEFMLKPDPAVKAGPMYVTLALTTGAALLMFIMALNASFLPIITRKQAPNVYLVMGAMGVTGIVTGLLTVGREASPFVTRLVLASIALTFITLRHVRLVRAPRVASDAEAASASLFLPP